MGKFLLATIIVLGACSTKANPNACCVSADDCKQAGLSTMKSCDQGLTCVSNQCIQETCSTDGCMAAQPVCNVVTNVCEGCTDSSQCASYPGATVCDATSGGCVGCVAASDCPAAKPVCDMGSCRACAADADCASGACADDGTCVAESAIVYLDAAGTDTGSCPRSAPCRSITYGATQTTDLRAHVVMNTGAYVEIVRVTAPPTPLVYIHGGGSTVTAPSGMDVPLLNGTGLSIRNLTLVNDGGAGALLGNGELRHAHIRTRGNGFSTDGTVTVVDSEFEGENALTGVSLGPNAVITLDRVVIHGWAFGIQATNFGSRINVTNALIYGMSDLAMDISMAGTSTIAFTTIADSGTTRTADPRAVSCGTDVTFRSSIVWAPGSTTLLPLQGCNVATSIAGPGAISGVSNADPMFVNSAQHDYHLAAGSPAIDFAQSGPDHDFEGDTRPKGAGYDIGADEAR